MERAKRIAIVLVCVCAVLVAAKSSTSKTSGTRQDAAKAPQSQVRPAAAGESRVASCIVKITADPAVFPLYFGTIDYLVRSSGVAGKAARQVLDLPAERIDEILELEELSDETFQFAVPPVSQGSISNQIQEEASSKYDEMLEAGFAATPGTLGESGTLAAIGPYGRRDAGTTGPGRTAGTAPATGAGSRRGGRIRYYDMSRPTAQGIPSSFEQDMIVFRLSVHLPDDCPKLLADDFMRAVVARLSAELDRAFSDHRQQLDRQRTVADEEAEGAEQKLLNMQESLGRISSSRSREGLLADISTFNTDVERWEMQSTLSQARVKEMDRQIAESQAKLKDQLANDSVARELRQIVTINEQQLQQVAELTKQKTASAAELQQVQEKLARARIELAKRQEELSKSAAGNAIDSLNRQIADMAMRSTENEAQMAQLRNRIRDAMGRLADADKYELLSLKVDIAKQNLRETIVWRDQLSRRVRLAQPPSVSVIGAD